MTIEKVDGVFKLFIRHEIRRTQSGTFVQFRSEEGELLSKFTTVISRNSLNL
jgi:hypothetical protein